MISQQQATSAVIAIGCVAGYVLWSLLATGNFLPYTQMKVPIMENISLFVILGSVLLGVFAVVVYSFAVTIYSWIRKRAAVVEGKTIFGIFLTVTSGAIISLFFHLLRLIRIEVTLLSCLLFYGIVEYGKFRKRRKLQKYATAGSRTRTGESPLKV
ncbi:MAG: hypothetical protein QY312_02840 [Candidatus Dojkabacteria bacterium]|nr:MAG: hypothetical protein QY312_02840 [Candidatus Dojkabacteria bacterium]